MTFRIGIDIGGTFTDGVMIDNDTGKVHVEKVLTTPNDLSDAFISTVDSLMVRYDLKTAAVAEVMHASTIATNALLERKGAKVGLLVTAGFRDVLEIGRQVRHELYNVFTSKPEPLVPRKYAMEIRERMDYRGEVVHPLSRQDVVDATELLLSEGVDSIAICFLHSYRNGQHERLAAQIVREIHPKAALSISSAIAPEIKEYWRASTTCVNAYVGPPVRRYLDRVVNRLSERGFTGEVGIMHSGGGIEGIEAVRDRPFQLLESGPAAGVAAAAHFARVLGHENALSFDMGGTTAKAGLILNGMSHVLSEFEVGGDGHSGSSIAKASGYPVLGEVVDLVEVGAGGGSLAWLDDGGHLRVGPQGAGASPGPACYGLGGERPTITDANLVLGRLDPNHFLGGTMKLSRIAAENAIGKVCAGPLGLTVEQAASGIIEIADATMIAALRLVSVERGHDPRDFCLIAFGGAGPVHAVSLASQLGIPTVLVLPNPGVASAWGLLLSDIKHDVRATNLLPLAPQSMEPLQQAYKTLYTRMDEQLAKEIAAQEQFKFNEFLEARYVGQSSRLRLDSGTANTRSAVELCAQFNAQHEREFGYCVVDEPIEIVTLGVTAVAARRPDPPDVKAQPAGPVILPKSRRDVYFGGFRQSIFTPVYAREDVHLGQRIEGPAIVEEFDSTTVIDPGFAAEVLEMGVLRIQRSGGTPEIEET